MNDLPKEVQELIDKNPMMVIVGLLTLQYLMQGPKRPEWLGDCPPIHGRRNGAWRGKGSFGKTGLGVTKVHHK